MMNVYERSGYCPTCSRQTRFVSEHAWLRDHYRCTRCGSIPRERALHWALNQYFPGWVHGRLHEGSPSNRRVAVKVKDYSASQYYVNKPPGASVGGFRNEDLERLTFVCDSFDFFITLDVLEHVFNPRKAVEEMYRVVRPGGVVAFTTPIYKNLSQTRQRSALRPDGTIEYLLEPVYHGNPVGDGRSLVTWDYGQDYLAILKDWTKGTIIHVNEVLPENGIEGEFLDVFLIVKQDRSATEAAGSQKHKFTNSPRF